MTSNLFDNNDQEPWRSYPRLFKPQTIKTFAVLAIGVCIFTLIIGFKVIPLDAQIEIPLLDKLPVPVATAVLILIIIPFLCLLPALLISLVPIGKVPYKTKVILFFLIVLIVVEAYGLKDLIILLIKDLRI